MNKQRLYYTPPTDEQFNELKSKTVEVWKEYDNEYGYVDEKVGRIWNIMNVGDNFMYIVAMMDCVNQGKLANKLSKETRLAVRARMIDGGNKTEDIAF